MKHMTRILALLLALVLCLGLSVTAFATEAEQATGTITINNAVNGQTYTIYRILELESYNATEGQEAYSYKAASDAWSTFINSDAIKNHYVKVDDQGYVTWVTGAEPADFAKLALAYAQNPANNITPAANETTTATGTTVTFNALPLGYYLVDSTVGTLCALDTTKPSMSVNDKHTAPIIDKQVKEGNNWGKVNDASIGDAVYFQVTIDAKAGAQNYVFRDTMSAGLTFDKNSVVVKKGETNAAVNTDYTVETENLDDGCTFEVKFKQDYCDALKDGDTIVITYSATLNNQAVIAGAGNDNKGVLKYGEKKDLETKPSTTKTYTWDFEVFKFGNGNRNKGLEGAKFVVLSQDGNKVATIVGGKITAWVQTPAATPAGEVTWPENTVLTTNEQGKIDVAGLDSGTYKLREVKAPDGYNKLKDDKEFTISREENATDSSMSYNKLTVEVENNSGTILPSTGGMGTTIFYVLGGILAVGAAVLLVTKKRMERI